MAADVKKKALIYLTLALMLTVLAGAGLPRLQFRPGLPLPSLADGRVFLQPTAGQPPVGAPVSLIFKIVVLVATALFTGYLCYRLIKGIHWKEVLRESIRLLFVLLMAAGVIAAAVALLPKSEGQAAPGLLPAPWPVVRAPLGPTPSLLIWLVGIGLVCAALLVAAWMVRAARARVPQPWEIEVENARRALLAGGDLKNIILECYRQMSRALEQDRDIEREAFMTTGEFERLLTARGVPYEPVHQLTRLFEGARYGRGQPGEGDEEAALRCLDAIRQYSRARQRAEG